MNTAIGFFFCQNQLKKQNFDEINFFSFLIFKNDFPTTFR